MDLTRRQRITLVLVAIVVASALVGFVAAEDLLAGFYTTSDTIHRNATDGPEVITTKDYSFQSGNPFTDTSVNITTENNGWINVSASDPDSSQMVVQLDQINGVHTNASGITATSGNITLDPDDKGEATVGGEIDEIKFRSMGVDDDATDFIYSASGTATVVASTDGTQGTQYGAIDADTNEGLDVGIADANGDVAFTDLPSGTHTVEIEELGTLTIREETSPHNKITGSTATVRFFESTDDDPVIVERTDGDGDGEIDLTGLPVNEEFVAAVKAPGYHNRTVVIEDLSQQETIFLLDKTATTVSNTFTIQDESGNFPPGDATLQVQKSINRTEYDPDADGFSWLSITGDRLGADQQLIVTLDEEDRYRMKVSNEDGDTRILGEYNAREDGTVTLRIERVNVSVLGGEDGYGWNATQENVSGTETIKFRFEDTERETTDLQLMIYEQGNRTNEIENSTHSGPFGTFTHDEQLTDEQANTTWVVEFEATRSGEIIDAKQVVGVGQRPVVTGLSDWIKHTIAIGSLILAAFFFTGVRAEAGAVVVALLSGFWYYVDFLPPEITAGVIVLQFGVSGAIMMRSQRGF